jgi:light-regulated signal transduction histidine kinase (bacteriophytochrome)
MVQRIALCDQSADDRPTEVMPPGRCLRPASRSPKSNYASLAGHHARCRTGNILPGRTAVAVKNQQKSASASASCRQLRNKRRSSSRKSRRNLPKNRNPHQHVGDDLVCCIVEDSGPGIDPHFSHLFEDAFTTKKSGMGIGLIISRSIVETHGGEISADNNSSFGGARFTFTLPVTSDCNMASHSQ